jgi:hypothetical protein
VHRALHTVIEQRLLHRTRRHDERVEDIALGHREATRQESHDWARHQRHVVMQVLFEVRVIGLDDRNAQSARQRSSLIVRDERSLDVHQVRLQLLELRA